MSMRPRLWIKILAGREEIMCGAPTIKSLLENMYPPWERPGSPSVISERFEAVVKHAAASVDPSPWRKRLDNAVLIGVIVLMGGVVTLACIYS